MGSTVGKIGTLRSFDVLLAKAKTEASWLHMLGSSSQAVVCSHPASAVRIPAMARLRDSDLELAGKNQYMPAECT